MTKGYLLTNFIDINRKCFYPVETNNIANDLPICQEFIAIAFDQEMINRHYHIGRFSPLDLMYLNYDLFDTIFLSYYSNIFDWFSESFFQTLKNPCHLIISFPLLDIVDLDIDKVMKICEEMVKNTVVNTIQLYFDKDSDIRFLEEITMDNRIMVVTDIKYPLLKAELEFYREAQVRHTFFNKNIFIDSKGKIKNAPECEEAFGNIHDIKNVEGLKKIISTPEFQKYWFVHKELCDVCKDCEFRHMCVDNRLPYQRKDGSWYHKQECNYNPYICKWREEDGYKTLIECGIISNENGFNKNDEIIREINHDLWM